MASTIPGYEYDIFISYRQKDNKGDKWVSKFVDALKTELEAAFKDDISVYFDENPHDRLQETHNVDKSLEAKLKCLIFIPILSQTYCDPNCYAWQYEFLAFNKLAAKDHIGRDIKLRNGNYASRILPIRIHDLEQEDVKLFEKETGSVLRAMDFVFKTASGVNRPLKANEDHPNDNLNKTFYTDQINKTENAIKEIISGLKTEPLATVDEKTLHRKPLKEGTKEESLKGKREPVLLTKHRVLTSTFIFVVLIAFVLIYSKVLQSGKTKVARDPDGKISIAVNTFDNLTGDTALNSWRLGIQELLINNLGTSKELSIQNSQTMFEVYKSLVQAQNASVDPSLSKEAAIKLKARTYVIGNFIKTGNKIRIQAKLIDTKSDELLWTGKVDGNLNSDFIDLSDSLSKQVKNFLEIKALEQNSSLDFKEAYTNSADAYRKYIEGMNSFINEDYFSAIQSFKEALKFDSTFTLASFFIANAYSNNADIDRDNARLNYRQLPIWIQKAYKGKERLPVNYQLWLEEWKAIIITKNMEDVLTYNSLLENSDIKSRYYWYDIANTYGTLQKYDKAVKAFEKVEAISSEWGGDWKFVGYYIWFGDACHGAGLHKKETKIYETGLNLYPDNLWLLSYQARCAISQQGDMARATKSVRKFIEVSKTQGHSQSQIEIDLGQLYLSENSFDKAEEHYRIALKLNPSDSNVMSSLAFFLIYYDRNVDEGMNLIISALKISPANETTLWAQGLGYYKQGKNEEALSLLKAAKDSSLYVYPTLDRQIQDVKKALANKK